MEPQYLGTIGRIHTLGPEGSNLEAAAWKWLSDHQVTGRVELHSSVERAVQALDDASQAVMACAAYPALHDLVFSNLGELTIIDTFLMPTHSMVLARTEATEGAVISTCAAHPAPRALVPAAVRWISSSSNSQAASDCAAGLADSCITTQAAADRFGLTTLIDHGPVDMAFTLHAHPSIRTR